MAKSRSWEPVEEYFTRAMVGDGTLVFRNSRSKCCRVVSVLGGCSGCLDVGMGVRKFRIPVEFYGRV